MASSTDFEGLFVGLQIGREAAFIANRGGIAALLQHAFQGVKHFRAHAQRFGERSRAVGHDHELLRVDGVIGVRSAVQNVHHRNRQQVGAHAAQIAIERRHLRLRGGARHRHGDGQNGVRAELGFIRRAVQLDHFVIDGGLLFRFHAQDRRRDFLVDILNGLARSFAEIALGIVIAQLHGLMLAGGSAGGNGGPSNAAIGEVYISLDRGVAARIEDLAANDFGDFHILLFEHTCHPNTRVR